MKKCVKVIFSLLIVFIMFFMFVQSFSVVEAWKPDFEQFDNQDTGNTGKMVTNAGSVLISIFQIMGLGVAITMLVVNGISYVFTAVGDKKAEIKKHLGNYALGCVFVLAASAILEIVKDFLDKNYNDL